MVFLTSCVGINLGDIPRGLQHPRDVPLVDPSTLGRKTLYELASLKYCYNARALRSASVDGQTDWPLIGTTLYPHLEEENRSFTF